MAESEHAVLPTRIEGSVAIWLLNILLDGIQKDVYRHFSNKASLSKYEKPEQTYNNKVSPAHIIVVKA